MTTLLSSRLTFFCKFIFPVLWGGFWSLGTAELFTNPGSVDFHWHISFLRFGGGPPPPWVKWLFVGFLFVGSFACARIAIPLKSVVLEDGFLRISNYVRAIRVPIGDVIEVGFDSDATVNGKSLIGLRFRSHTDFGRSIEFLPRSRGAIELLRARLGPSVGGALKEDDGLASELRGRGTV